MPATKPSALALALALATAILGITPDKALASYSTAIFTARSNFCTQVANSGGSIVDRPLMIDRAVMHAIGIWPDEVKDRSAFRNQVIQSINSEGCGVPQARVIPTQPSARSYPTEPAAPAYGGNCVAVINGVRMKACSGRF
jgi:hypothetical protein